MTAPGPHSPPDRFVTGPTHSPLTPWEPDDPRPLDQTPYLEYLERVELGLPTGKKRLRELHPDPPCHTGGAGPRSACPTCHDDGTGRYWNPETTYRRTA